MGATNILADDSLIADNSHEMSNFIFNKTKKYFKIL